MSPPPLLPACYPIVDCELAPDPELFAQQLLVAGTGIIQLRWKNAPKLDFLRLASNIVTLRNQISPTAIIIINDRVDVSLESKANGVHLGQQDLSPIEARQLLGDNAVIGLSTHNVEQVRYAANAPVDYFGFGPVFDSPTKSGQAPVTGVDTLRHAAEIARKPVVAIGGISRESAPEIFSAGACSCAVISDVLSAGSDLKHYLLDWDTMKNSG